jgi:hypothetical protein
MKPIFLPLLLLLLALPLMAGVGPAPKSPAYIEADQAKVNEAFADLDALEMYLEANPGATLSELQSQGNSLVADAEMVNGLGVSNALANGDAWATWLIVLLILGGLAVVGCCILFFLWIAAYY